MDDFNDEGQQGTDEGQGTAPEGVEAIELSEGAKVRLGEKELDYATLQEALKDHENKSNWQREYTQRDMSLAEQRKALAKSAQLEEYLNANPDKYAEVEAIFRKANPVKENDNPEIRSMREQLEEVKSTIAVKDELGRIDQEFKEIESNERNKVLFEKNPQLKNEVAKFAYENGIMSIKDAFKAYTYDMIQAVKVEEGMQAGAKAGAKTRTITQPGGSKAGASKPNLKGGYDALEARLNADPRYNFS